MVKKNKSKDCEFDYIDNTVFDTEFLVHTKDKDFRKSIYPYCNMCDKVYHKICNTSSQYIKDNLKINIKDYNEDNNDSIKSYYEQIINYFNTKIKNYKNNKTLLLELYIHNLIIIEYLTDCKEYREKYQSNCIIHFKTKVPGGDPTHVFYINLLNNCILNLITIQVDIEKLLDKKFENYYSRTKYKSRLTPDQYRKKTPYKKSKLKSNQISKHRKERTKLRKSK
jgi:hypothetical protein